MKKNNIAAPVEPHPSAIYGRNAVEEALQADPVRVSRVFIRDGLMGDWVRQLKMLASDAKVPLQSVPGPKLRDLAGAVNDQGVVALLSEVAFLELEDWLPTVDMSTNPVVVVFDHLEDPHNAGAIVRTAVAAGAVGVVLPKHQQSGFHGAAVKASSGQLFKIPMIRVVNINQTLVRLQEHGFWIAGLDMDAQTLVWDFRADMPLAVVAGNEAKGLSDATKKYCDLLVKIPMLAGVESLNVSVSTSILLYEIVRRRLKAL